MHCKLSGVNVFADDLMTTRTWLRVLTAGVTTVSFPRQVRLLRQRGYQSFVEATHCCA